MFERDSRRTSSPRRSGLLAAALLAALAGTAAAPALAQETIKIGAPLALTGGLADEGHKQDLVWKMWVEKVNAGDVALALLGRSEASGGTDGE